jgi:hypothetical protein
VHARMQLCSYSRTRFRQQERRFKADKRAPPRVDATGQSFVAVAYLLKVNSKGEL